jgi:hypothetical protein
MSDAPDLELLIAHPLFGLALTVGVYAIATLVHERLGRPSMLHPVLTSVAAIAALLVATGLSYPVYFAQAAPLHNALSVFVVLLAVPLVRRLPLIRAARLPISGRAFDRVCRCRNDSVGAAGGPRLGRERRRLARAEISDGSRRRRHIRAARRYCRPRGNGRRSDGTVRCNGRSVVIECSWRARRARGRFRDRRGRACEPV